MSDDETLFHVKRADLPWRDATLTECGIKAAKNPTITHEELLARVARQGQRKTELVCCQTCWTTGHRYGEDRAQYTEDQKIIWAVQREIERRWREPKMILAAELRALGVLVARHRAEFDELRDDVVMTVPIGKRNLS